MSQPGSGSLEANASHGSVSIRHIQPHRTVKDYLCPGCEGTIPQETFHLVVIPSDEPDLRRHWHHECWYKEANRLWGRDTPAAMQPVDANRPERRML